MTFKRKVSAAVIAVAICYASIGGDMARRVTSIGPYDLPENFSAYATVEVDEDAVCVAGAVSDEDGMNEKPYVYVEDGGRVIWSKFLEIPADFYQGRATHCERSGTKVYVLLQEDTQSQQSLSQTLLKVVVLNFRDGSIESERTAEVAGVREAYSAWVRHGDANFKLTDGTLAIRGNYRPLDSDDILAFRIDVEP